VYAWRVSWSGVGKAWLEKEGWLERIGGGEDGVGDDEGMFQR